MCCSEHQDNHVSGIQITALTFRTSGQYARPLDHSSHNPCLLPSSLLDHGCNGDPIINLRYHWPSSSRGLDHSAATAVWKTMESFADQRWCRIVSQLISTYYLFVCDWTFCVSVHTKFLCNEPLRCKVISLNLHSMPSFYFHLNFSLSVCVLFPPLCLWERTLKAQHVSPIAPISPKNTQIKNHPTLFPLSAKNEQLLESFVRAQL